MKRIFAAAGGFLLALSLAACTSGAGNQPSAGVPVPSATADTESEGPSDTSRPVSYTHLLRLFELLATSLSILRLNCLSKT